MIFVFVFSYTMKKYLFTQPLPRNNRDSVATPRAGAGLIILIWLWLTMALLALFISPSTPPWDFLDFKALILLIESSKLFFIVIIFPLIINRLSLSTNPVIASDGAVGAKRGNRFYWQDCLKSFIILILLSLPLTIMASHLGDVTLGILLRVNLLLLLIAGFISLLSFRYSLIYYLVVFLLFGVGPILYYLVLELSGASWGFLFMINPFRLFWNINNPEAFNPAWLVQCLVWGVLIIIILEINNKIIKGN